MMKMNDPNDRDHELDKRLAVLEERMKTLKAENETAFERLRSDIATRETRMLLAIAGMLALAVTVLGILISLPVAS